MLGVPPLAGALDEVYVKVNGGMVYSWRAVDHDKGLLKGYVTALETKAKRSPS